MKKVLSFGLAFALLLGFSASLGSTQVAEAQSYETLTLTPASELKILIQAKPVSIQNGKWTYEISWNRVRDMEGSIYVYAKTDKTTPVASLATAPRVGKLTVTGLNPATRYQVEFYATTKAECEDDDPECVLIRYPYFNTLDANGNKVTTAQISVANGGTGTGTTGTTTTNPTDPAYLSGLQAQIDRLLALVQSLIAQLAGQGGTVTTPGPAGMCDYSEPPVGCSWVNGPAFNSTTQCGKILNCPTTTANIPTNTTAIAVGSTVPLPGDVSIPIGKGGFKTDCPIPAPVTTRAQSVNTSTNNAPMIVLNGSGPKTVAAWACLGGQPDKVSAAGNVSYEWVTFDNGVRLPSSLFANIFLNHPRELAYRKMYKILHFVPFANNPTVTSPNDPEAAINLPYPVDVPGITQSTGIYELETTFKGDLDFAMGNIYERQDYEDNTLHSKQIKLKGGFSTYVGGSATGVEYLFPNLSYNVRWKPFDKTTGDLGRADSVPIDVQAVDVYIFHSDDICPGWYPGINAVSANNNGRGGCAANYAKKLADEAQGKFFDTGGRGFFKVASNVPYKNGQAQFFMPEPRNITYPGKITNALDALAGSYSIIIMDSRASTFLQRDGDRAPLIFTRTMLSNGIDPVNRTFPNPPTFTNEEIKWKTPIAMLPVRLGNYVPLNQDSYIKVDTVANGVGGPMPWYVWKTDGVHSGVTGSAAVLTNNAWFREITVAGSVGRPFWQSMYYVQKRLYEWSPITPAPEVTFDGQPPPGLSRNTNFGGHNTESGAVPVANIEGTPTQAGTYVMDVKTKVRRGNKTVEGITRYRYFISPMRKLDIVFQDLNGKEITGAVRAGDTIRILKIGDDLSTDPTKLYIAQYGTDCVGSTDPRKFGKCGGNIAVHPDFVKKTPLGDILKDSPCNNSMMGGNDPLMGNCAEYTWRVGNTPGLDTSSGSFVVYGLPTKLAHDGFLHLGGTETFDPLSEGSSGQWDFYAAGQLNITQGTGGTSSGTTNTGNYINYIDPVFRGSSQNINFTCTVNGRDVGCMGGNASGDGTDFVNNQWVSNRSFAAQPGDSVTIRWSSKPTNRGTFTIPSNAVWGSDWDSKVEMVTSGWANSINGTQRNECTRSINPPAGFGFSQADFTNVMKGPEGTTTFTIPDCLKGGGMIMTYTAHLGNTSFKDTLRMSISVGGWRPNDDIVQNSPVYNPTNPNATATCNVVPNMFDGLSGNSLMNDWDTRNICTGSGGLNGTCYTANYAVDYPSAKFDRLLFRSGTDLSAVMGGCSAADMSAGKCIMKSGDPGDSLWPNGMQGTAQTNIVVKGTRPNTTYWNRVVAICNYGQSNQQYSEAVWPYTTRGPACTGLLNCSN